MSDDTASPAPRITDADKTRAALALLARHHLRITPGQAEAILRRTA